MTAQGEPAKPRELNNERVVIYLTASLLAELDARAKDGDEDSESNRSRIVRKALRESFRRHPRKGT